MKRINLKSIVPFTLLLSSVGINNNDSNLIMAKSNLNYDSEVTVSSESSDHGKALINDFNYDTYWEGTEANNQSVVLDLLSIKKVTSVTQIFKDEDVWFFTIEASIDGENYFQIVDHSKGAFGRSFEESVTTYARYVRLNVVKSEKGYMPSSKEFYVNFDEISEGENLALGAQGGASSSQGNYLPEKAFDGNSATYWCASSGNYEQWLSVELGSFAYVKNVVLHLNDYGSYEFEVEGRNANGEWVKVVERAKFNGSTFTFSVEGKYDAFVYRTFAGPGWANLNEFEINGFKEITNYSQEDNIMEFPPLTYIDSFSGSESIEYSLDKTNWHTLNKDSEGVNARYIRSNSQVKIYGTCIQTSLLEGMDGKVSDYLDHNHLLSNITTSKTNASYTSRSWKSPNVGQKETIDFDLGRISLLNNFEIIIPANTLSSISIEVSSDGLTYQKYADSADISEETTTLMLNNENIQQGRYIRIFVTPQSDKQTEIINLSLYGLGNSKVENWWEDTSGVIRFYPKLQKVSLNEITSRLDEFRNSGYKVIELHQPYEGLADIWAGLGGTNNYMVDPLIGTLDDLLRLLGEAHKRDMYVFMFGNVGYGKNIADYFKKACKDYALGIDSKERNWFVFSDTCPDPTKWFYSDIAKAYYYGYWGENGQIPTFNFENEEWQDEVYNYIDYWSSIGFDGIALDAPNVYYFGNANASRVTYETITKTMIKKNLFVLPEGTGDNSFISNYHYSCIQNYGLSSWGGGAFSLGLNNAQTNSVNDTENVLKNNRDMTVSLGGVSMGCMNFEDNYLNETGNNRVLEAALVTQTGHLAFLHSGSDARIGQDIMANWDEDIQSQIHSLFGIQNSMAALNPSGHRYKLTSTNESKIYAYLKKDLHNNSIVMPIFNYAIVDIDYQINLQNTELNFEDGEYIFYDAFNDENVNVTIRGGIMSLSSPKESYRCLIIR